MNKNESLYASVTQSILDALEHGTPPWQRSWFIGSASRLPRNFSTDNPYRGINALRKVGLYKAVSELLITMRGRMLHDLSAELSFQLFGAGRRSIKSEFLRPGVVVYHHVG